jgi:UDP-N-acetylmuramoyl-L-alanyl-D-glutamate--2,6-diaminopimelate ligase
MSAAMNLATSAKPLHELARELAAVSARVEGDGDVVVSDVRQDSRRVEPGDLFVARAGGKTDGAAFVMDAVRRGAVAVLAQTNAPLPLLNVPVVRVDDARRALGLAAEAVHDHPTAALDVIGITGTNGKTTTAWLAEQVLSRAGGAAARLGTLGYSFQGDTVDESLTTPEADDVSRFADRALRRGARQFVMEVSSIALVQARVDAVRFAVAAFTNFTQDHLDFHGSMDAYGAAKARLFVELAPAHSVVFVDDPFGKELASRARGNVLTVGRSEGADLRAVDVRTDARGIAARLVTRAGASLALESRLVGAHNLDNVLVTLGIASALGLDLARATAAMATATAAPGRLERCDELGDDVTVLVDYAHTPDALARVLDAVRALVRDDGTSRGKVHCVFGCGGDRDPAKRPRMGEAVGARADRATLTNDNPRTEEPAAIAAAVEPALRASGIPYDVVLDRKDAITHAILEAAPGDLVLLAGKGHEPYQIIGTEYRAFDDRVEARRALALRRGARA